jgi:hypothetical protein
MKSSAAAPQAPPPPPNAPTQAKARDDVSSRVQPNSVGRASLINTSNVGLKKKSTTSKKSILGGN